MPTKKPSKTTIIDPISEAMAARSAEPPLIEREPIRGWVEGLVRIKIARGRGYSWADMQHSLTSAAKAALVPGAKIRVGGVERAPTPAERVVLAEFAQRKYGDGTMSFLVQRSYPELWSQAVGKTRAE